LDDNRSERVMDESKPDPYGEDLLYANWNPVIEAIAALDLLPVRDSSPKLPKDSSEKEVDDFLARVYVFATQC